ncbi:MAG: hypothetical protein C5B43_03485 [Verrucomicrobia bacterium]|nr:MAG: hypothetical protein C5B43_03485 [Verrucomicrobiota bacterium]
MDEAAQIDWLDSEVKSTYNYAYHDVVAKVIEVYDRWYETTTPFTYAIVANQQEYTIDPSLIKVTRVEINYAPTQTNSTAARAVPINEDEVRGNLANTNNAGSFFSAAYYLHGNIGAQKIGFIPVPQVADTTGKSISIWGIQLPADLVNGTDDVNIPWADRFAYLIALRAAAMLLRKGQQEESAALRYMAEYEQGVFEMQTFLKDRQSDDGQFIIDSQLEQTDFSTLEIV